MNQVGAVIERDELHTVGKKPAVQIFQLLAKGAESGQRFFAALKEHDSFDGVVVMIHADLAQAGLRAFVHVGNIAQVNRDAIVLGDQNILHFGNGVQQADAANVYALARPW